MTRAANNLGMRAQTLSTQISQLEQQIGRSLFTPQGRGLALTEAGRAALRYADQIFLLGEQLQEALDDPTLGNTIRLTIGIADALPKTVSYRLLSPVFHMQEKVRVVCEEGEYELLLAELALHRLDVIFADRPVTQGGQSQFRSVPIAECPVVMFATPDLAARYREGFPRSLDRAPMLLPTRNNVLRGRLEQWFESNDLRVDVVGEIEDSALLKTLGRHGLGLFAVPSFAVTDITQPYGVEPVGALQGVQEQFFAITSARKWAHPAVEAIIQGAAA